MQICLESLISQLNNNLISGCVFLLYRKISRFVAQHKENKSKLGGLYQCCIQLHQLQIFT